jgi:hypothetical protein
LADGVGDVLLQSWQVSKTQVQLLGVMLFRILQDVFRCSAGCAHHYIILEWLSARLINILDGGDKREKTKLVSLKG